MKGYFDLGDACGVSGSVRASGDGGPAFAPRPGGEDAWTKLLISPGPSKAELLNKTCKAPVFDVLTRSNTAFLF